MADENNNKDAELVRVSAELGETKRKLDEERRKREQDLNVRLGNIEEKIDKGQAKILEEVQEVKLTYATATKLDRLEDDLCGKIERITERQNSHSRQIAMGIGGLLTLQIAIAVGLHFWK